MQVFPMGSTDAMQGQGVHVMSWELPKKASQAEYLDLIIIHCMHTSNHQSGSPNPINMQLFYIQKKGNLGVTNWLWDTQPKARAEWAVPRNQLWNMSHLSLWKSPQEEFRRTDKHPMTESAVITKIDKDSTGWGGEDNSCFSTSHWGKLRKKRVLGYCRSPECEIDVFILD